MPIALTPTKDMQVDFAVAAFEKMLNSLHPTLFRLEKASVLISTPALAYMAAYRASVLLELGTLIKRLKERDYEGKFAIGIYRGFADALDMIGVVETPLSAGGQPQEPTPGLDHLPRERLIAIFEARADAIIYAAEAIREVVIENVVHPPKRKQAANLQSYMDMIVRRLAVAEEKILCGKVDLDAKTVTAPVRH